MRGVIENVAASFTLFGDRVFRVGDTVIHEDEWGVSEDIGFRSTRCRTFEGFRLHIPNKNLMDDTIRNVSARPCLRSRFRLSLVYDTPPDKVDEAIDIVHAVIDEQGEAVDRGEGINVVFDAFGAHDLQILVQYYTASADYWTAKGTMSGVDRALLHRFEAAGIAFAFPTQTTLLATDDEAVPVPRRRSPARRRGSRSAAARRSRRPATPRSRTPRWRCGGSARSTAGRGSPRGSGTPPDTRTPPRSAPATPRPA